MLAIVVSRAGEPPWRKTFAAGDIAIGSGAGMQLVLDADSADALHAQLVVRDGKVIARDRGSAGGTFVDGLRLTAPLVIAPEAAIAIGAYTLRAFLDDQRDDEPFEERAAAERELLAAIARGDDASRAVYADWLEGEGDLARAELLRLQHALDAMSPDTAGFERATDRLRELASGLELGWRARVARRSIEACAFDFECPKQWSALALTDRDGVRHCGSCKHDVHYCASIEDARAHAAQGRCVALDVTCARYDADLDPPFGVYTCTYCDADVGLRDRCPRCGSHTPRQMVRGRLAVRNSRRDG